MYLPIYPVQMNLIPEWTEQIHCISYGDMHGKSYFPEIWDTIVMPLPRRNGVWRIEWSDGSVQDEVLSKFGYYCTCVQPCNTYENIRCRRII